MSIKISTGTTATSVKDISDLKVGMQLGSSKDVQKVIKWDGTVIWERKQPKPELIDISDKIHYSGMIYGLGSTFLYVKDTKENFEGYNITPWNEDRSLIRYRCGLYETYEYQLDVFTTNGQDAGSRKDNCIVIKVSNSDYRLLEKDTDYTVEYENISGSINVYDSYLEKTAFMTIRGIESAGYTGSVKKPIKICATMSDRDTYCTISTKVFPEGSGTVSGGSTYKLGEKCTLTANGASDEWHFSYWNTDYSDRTNPKTFTVTTAATYTAFFAKY